MLIKCWPGSQCLASLERSRAETVTNNSPRLARESGWDVDQWNPVQCLKISVHKIQKIVQALILSFLQFFGDLQSLKEVGELFRLDSYGD